MGADRVRALDVETADDILADMELALALRPGPEPPSPDSRSPTVAVQAGYDDDGEPASTLYLVPR